MTTKLQRLCAEQGQSPWLDNLRRGWITGGELQAWVDKGIRGITSNPSIFQKAMGTGDDYDQQLAELAGQSIDDAYWALVVQDIEDALGILRPVYDTSDGLDGFVSVEVAPALARDTDGTIAAARELHQRIAEPNLYVKIPGTAEGIPAIRQMIAEGRSINVTLIFSLEPLRGGHGGLPQRPRGLRRRPAIRSAAWPRSSSVGSTRRSTGASTRSARPRRWPCGARPPWRRPRSPTTSSWPPSRGPRWEALSARGARVQRPLWASTSTKNPAYPDTLYIDSLIGPETVNTIPDTTLEAFEDHGTVARTIDADPAGAKAVLEAVEAVGVDMEDVGQRLEDEGVAAFEKAFDELLGTLGDKAEQLSA